MKRVAALQIAVLLACGTPPEPTPPTPPRPAIVEATPSASAPAAIASGEAPPVTRAPTNKRELGPAKPTTIPLRIGGPADDKLDRGDQLFEAGKLDDALRSYEAARAVLPRHPAPIVGVLRVRIAKLDLSLGYASAKGRADVKAIVLDLRKASAMDAGYGAGHAELGRGLLLLGDAPAAREALGKARELMSDVAEVHSAYGVACLAAGASEEAVKSLERAVELDPGSAPRHGNFGTVLLMRGRVKDAIAQYEIQVELSDGDARAHSDLGTALLAESNFERAIPELERALAIEPGRATFHSNLGYALQLSGKRDRAIGQYRKAIELDPRLASAWINLATALARDPKTRAEARAALKKAEEIDPSDPRVKSNLEELDALERGVNLNAAPSATGGGTSAPPAKGTSAPAPRGPGKSPF